MANKCTKIIAEIGRVLIGCTFVFSGFVKAVDPLGSAYKFHDYFATWGINWLEWTTLPASFGLSALEFALGVCLLFGVYRKLVSWLILLFMAFMTLLTLYLAIYNPVTDCGCFGDALVITNWQTFYKNVVLIAFSIIVFIYNQQLTRLCAKKWQKWICAFSCIFILGFSFYCYTFLPVLDFRPYKIGNNILELSAIPDDAESDVYETTLVYEKNGVKQKFSLNDYPKGDPEWKFVETTNTLIKKGYEPPIHYFIITTEDGEEITDVVLADTSYTFLLIAHKLTQAKDSHCERINWIFDYAAENNYRFLCLTASTSNEIEEWKSNTGAEYPFCITDGTTLKTIIRSNPGLVLLKDAKVIGKWPHTRLPKRSDLTKLMDKQ